MTSQSDPSAVVRILGVGNVLMGDDALGPYAVRVLESRYVFPEAVEVLDVGTPGLDFTPYLANARAVIVIDTVRSDGEPGSLKIYRDQELVAAPPPSRMSPHEPGLREALMATELTDSSPGNVTLIGVVPHRVENEIGLSAPLRSAVDAVLDGVMAELARFGIHPQERPSPGMLDIWWEAAPDTGDSR